MAGWLADEAERNGKARLQVRDGDEYGEKYGDDNKQ